MFYQKVEEEEKIYIYNFIMGHVILTRLIGLFNKTQKMSFFSRQL